MRYIVQARNNTSRRPHDWDNSRYGGDTLESAREAERQLLANDAAWMRGTYKRETRVYDTDGVRS